MPQTAWYKSWFNSPHYYTLYQHRDYTEAYHFIERLLNHLQPKIGSKMLDVACGKGRYSKVLFEHGFDVTGIDIAADAIAEAKQQEEDRLQFYVHDMRQPFWINYFDIAFNFFTSFGYFRTKREHDAALRTISQSLLPQGTFVIDYLNVAHATTHLVAHEQKHIDDTYFNINRWADDAYFYKQIAVSTDGTHFEVASTEKVAKFTLSDFQQMLAKQGLTVNEVFGNYQLGNYDSQHSERLIIVATKQ